MQKLRDKSEDYFIKSITDSYDIIDRTTWNIISIDPKNSKDFDDAFGIKSIDKNTYLLSIYIAFRSNLKFTFKYCLRPKC